MVTLIDVDPARIESQGTVSVDERCRGRATAAFKRITLKRIPALYFRPHDEREAVTLVAAVALRFTV